MARPIVLSNGELHVGINNYGLVHDFYFPYVGLENHAAGKSLRHHVGVWVDGTISWLDGGDWEFRFRYPHKALIGHTIAKNEKLGVLIEFDDVIDASVSAFMRNIHVVNLRDSDREIRLFMHQAFVIGDSRSNTDTAQYLPDSHAILHYRGRRAFIISGTTDDEPFDQYTVGLFGIEGREGTYRDADDGELSFCNVEHGRVDSTLRFALKIPALSSKRAQYWIAAGTSLRESLYIHKQIRRDGVVKRLHNTAKWWQEWLKPALNVVDSLPAQHQDGFLRSLMVIKSQIDKRGAIIASTDTTMLNYSRDAYAYAWPRDGAYAMWPLIRLGYINEPRRFFEFCRRGMHPSGYLHHKYRADGAVGSSWHPYVHSNGTSSPPIQEDETALVLFMFAQFYHMHNDGRLLRDFYESMVQPMAHFLATYVDEKTGLPRATYDLWEERYLTTTYTTSVVYGALLVAADLAELAHDEENAVSWRAAAEDIQGAAQKHLFNPGRQAFYKGLLVNGSDIQYDTTLDTSSLFGAMMFGLFDSNSDEVKATHTTMRHVFNVTSNIGMPRYEHDTYFNQHEGSLGNWWIICTLWMAQCESELGDTQALHRAADWVLSKANTTGMLSEQIDPYTHKPLSVEPLTWSHSEYVASLLDIITEKQP